MNKNSVQMTKSPRRSNPLSIPIESSRLIEPEGFDYSYSRHVLKNGLKIVEVHQPHLHVGSIAVHIKAGSRFETPLENGLSHFLEHMVFRGTKKHPGAFELNLAIEKIGGTLFAATSPDSTEYGLSLPSENLAKGVSLLSEVVINPVFTNLEVERWVIIEEKKEDLDERGNDIDIDFLSRKRLWPAHPLGQSVLGPMENIKRFNIEDIRGHLKSNYIASKIVVCLTGAYDKNEIPKVIEREFESILKGNIIEADFGALPIGCGPTVLHVPKPGSQTQVRLAFHAFGKNDEDRAALSVMMNILDDGMSTRLHRRIFDELGLAYNIGADLDLYADAGVVNFDASTSHDKVARIAEEICSLVCELKDEPVGVEELLKAKNREIWGFKSFLDNPHAMNTWYGEQELSSCPPLIEERIRMTQAIEAEDIMRVARRAFTRSNMHITSVGTQSGVELRSLEKIAMGFC